MEDFILYDSYRPFYIAGMYYYKESVRHFIAGECQALEIKHEPLEKYPHALAVYGTWFEIDDEGALDCQEGLLGYVPDWLASQIYKIIKGMEEEKDYILHSEIFEISEDTGSIKIDLELFISIDCYSRMPKN